MSEILSTVIASLESNLSKLKASDKAFAHSLVLSYKEKGSLSPKQTYWAEILEKRAKSGGTGFPEKKVESLGAFHGVYALFAKAKEHLKSPKINLQIELDGGPAPIQLFVAGSKSKAPNVINVTDGKPFGSSKWYGRVYPDGKWEQPHYVHSELPVVKALLLELGEHPAEVAAAHGKLTGKCCFCNKPLTDQKHSVNVGFGEICAKNYGLHAKWKAAFANIDKTVLGAVGDFSTKEESKVEPPKVKSPPAVDKKAFVAEIPAAEKPSRFVAEPVLEKPKKEEREFLF